jgi:putative two-component system response regulator
MNLLIIANDADCIAPECFSTENYNLFRAQNEQSALESLANHKIDLIILAADLSETNSDNLCQSLRLNPVSGDIPILLVLNADKSDSEQARWLKLGVADVVISPINSTVLDMRIKTQLALKIKDEELTQYKSSMQDIVNQRTKEVELAYSATIESMATLAGYRQEESGLHIRRTQLYVRELAKQLRSHPRYKDYLSDYIIDMLYLSAPLHDIGKIALPDKMLQKRGKLSHEEFALMKMHTIFGYEAIIVSHHEKWDGTGYPYGLKGNNIPVGGRIMALADAYDALVSERPYRPAFSHEQATKVIEAEKGVQFDPVVVEAFLAIQQKFIKITAETAQEHK